MLVDSGLGATPPWGRLRSVAEEDSFPVEWRLEVSVPRQLFVDRVLPFTMHSVVVPQAPVMARAPPVADVATTVEISHAEEAATLDAEIAGLQMDE